MVRDEVALTRDEEVRRIENEYAKKRRPSFLTRSRRTPCLDPAGFSSTCLSIGLAIGNVDRFLGVVTSIRCAGNPVSDGLCAAPSRSRCFCIPSLLTHSSGHKTRHTYLELRTQQKGFVQLCAGLQRALSVYHGFISPPIAQIGHNQFYQRFTSQEKNQEDWSRTHCSNIRTRTHT